MLTEGGLDRASEAAAGVGGSAGGGAVAGAGAGAGAGEVAGPLAGSAALSAVECACDEEAAPVATASASASAAFGGAALGEALSPAFSEVGFLFRRPGESWSACSEPAVDSGIRVRALDRPGLVHPSASAAWSELYKEDLVEALWTSFFPSSSPRAPPSWPTRAPGRFPFGERGDACLSRFAGFRSLPTAGVDVSYTPQVAKSPVLGSSSVFPLGTVELIAQHDSAERPISQCRPPA
mmetsp:Transcript_43631/g.126952  ORF Transcript_43631/g.126952 Transcript_43631/m.126952 type:complete len:237 (+) Transcript_43631:389-1099(+)